MRTHCACGRAPSSATRCSAKNCGWSPKAWRPMPSATPKTNVRRMLFVMNTCTQATTCCAACTAMELALS